MATTITTPEDVVNLALIKCGSQMQIGSLLEGSDVATTALAIYGQVRDDVLRSFDWGFAERIAAAVLSAQPAPSPWTIAYVYPTDCLKVRNLFDAAYLTDKNNPLPNRFTIGNDPTVGKSIWTNLAAATLIYTRQVTNPSQWESMFVDALAAELAKELAMVVATADVTKMEAQDSQVSSMAAQGVIG